jgi:DNA-binding beta-propeller fold protein YncE
MRRSTLVPLSLGALTVAALASAPTAHGQLAVSANENKIVLVDGVPTVVRNPVPDTITILDVSGFPPRVVAEVEVPTSVAGPPLSVAITPDERLALVTQPQRIDPADPTRLVPGDRVSVIDLKASPPRVIAHLETGRQPSGVSIRRSGDLALVANRAEGTISVLRIQGATVTHLEKVRVGDEGSAPGHVAISSDGKTALVTRDGDHTISLLAIDGTRVTTAGRDMTAGIAPYGSAITPDGTMAVVANVGRVSGDADTISLIDLGATPPRVVQTVTVGQTPEGITLSPDGTLCAVVVMNGSNRPAGSPFHAARGAVLLYRLAGRELRKTSEAPIGRWSQGAAFTPDGRYLLVQNMVERDISVLEVRGDQLVDTGHRIAVSGGPAAIRIAERPAP